MLDNYQDLIDELLDSPKAIRAVIASASSDQTAELTNLLAELRDRDQALLERLQLIQRSRDPMLRPLPEPAATEEPLDDVLTTFDRARGELVSLLMNLTLRDWEREAIGPDGHTIRLAGLVEDHVDFDEEHVAAIESLTSA